MAAPMLPMPDGDRLGTVRLSCARYVGMSCARERIRSDPNGDSKPLHLKQTMLLRAIQSIRV